MAASARCGVPRRRAPARGRGRAEAEERQRLAALRKPIEARIQRLEHEIAACQATKSALDTRLASPDWLPAAHTPERRVKEKAKSRAHSQMRSL